MKAAHQFAWFALAGTLGFVVDAAVLYASASLLGWYGARLLSFVTAATVTWLVNRNVAFRASSDPAHPTCRASLLQEYLQYVSAMLGGAVLNYAAYVVVLQCLDAAYAPLLGVAAGSLAGLCANFFAARHLVFRSRMRSPMSVPASMNAPPLEGHSASTTSLIAPALKQHASAQPLAWVQALRGIAALMVLFFHMAPHWDLHPVLALSSVVTRWGFSGVDIFFALSGFVVYRSARRSIPAKGLWAFARKRMLRIYLGYWPVLLLIALTTVYVHHEALPELRKMVMSTLLLYPNIWDNWLPPAWSLSMEIYFYLWIGLIALLPSRHQIKAIILIMLALAAWGGFWLLKDPVGVINGHQPLRYSLTGLGLEFLAGALVAHAYDLRAHLFQTPRRTALVCTALMAGGLALGMTSPYFDRIEVMRAASFGVIGVCALVLALCLENTAFRPPRWLVLVGDASYSLYLLHTFLLDYSGRLRFENGIAAPAPLLAFLVALPVVIVALSLLWYRAVERPIMKAAL